MFDCHFYHIASLLLTVTHPNICGLELNQQGIEEGRQQYEIYKLKTELPNYGACWTSALEELNHDCKNLDDTTQATLALKFASCFLETSGQQPIACSIDDDVRMCLHQLGDRQFDTYREFFTHTHNMCSFLQVQVWHRQTGQVIDRLSWHASAVADRLERSGSVQADILRGQQRALTNQQRLIQHGQQMAHDVHDWKASLRAVVRDFKEQTAEHRDLILTVFERLTSLQHLVLDRFSWFNSVAYYVAGVVVVYLLTSTARTAAARLWLFLVLTCNLALERLLAGCLLSTGWWPAETAHQTAAGLDSAVWLLRRSAAILCLLLLTGAAYRYRDLGVVNNQLLRELYRHHLELRAHLTAKGVLTVGGSEPDSVSPCHTAPRRAVSDMAGRCRPPGPAPRLTAAASSGPATQGSPGIGPRSPVAGRAGLGFPRSSEDTVDAVAAACDADLDSEETPSWSIAIVGASRRPVRQGNHRQTAPTPTSDHLGTVMGFAAISGACVGIRSTVSPDTLQVSPSRYSLRPRPAVRQSPLMSPAGQSRPGRTAGR